MLNPRLTLAAASALLICLCGAARGNTVDVLVPAYAKLASYWPQFANDVSAFNASAVPEPSVASLLVASLGLLALRRRFRRAA